MATLIGPGDDEEAARRMDDLDLYWMEQYAPGDYVPPMGRILTEADIAEKRRRIREFWAEREQ
jgi:hypothetical protein